MEIPYGSREQQLGLLEYNLVCSNRVHSMVFASLDTLDSDRISNMELDNQGLVI